MYKNTVQKLQIGKKCVWRLWVQISRKQTDISIVMKLNLKLHTTARITLQSYLSFGYGEGVILGVVKNSCVGNLSQFLVPFIYHIVV